MSDPQTDQHTLTTDEVVAALVGLYSLAEIHLLMGASEVLRKLNVTLLAITPVMTAVEISTRTAENNLRIAAVMPKIRRTAERLVQMLGMRTPALIDAIVNTARGEASSAAGLAFDFTLPLGERAADLVRQELNTALQGTQARLLHWPDDLYRQLTAKSAIDQVLDNGLTPAQAQAKIWQEFTDRGITGFVDKAGRNWNLASYVEMSTRSAASRAFNDAHLATMVALGIELFTVDDDGNPCPLCWPWQGRVLSVTQDDRADATIADATAKGLFHPNCRHVLIKWIRGVHSPAGEVAKPFTAEQKLKYDDSQKQRRLERQVRQSKQAASIATDATSQKAALARVRANQAALRLLIDSTDLMQSPRREQPNLRLDVREKVNG